MKMKRFAVALPLAALAVLLGTPLAAHASFVELPAVGTIISSTTDFSSPLFIESNKFIYIGLGVTVAIAVALLIRRSLSRLVKGVTGMRRGRGRRRRR